MSPDTGAVESSSDPEAGDEILTEPQDFVARVNQLARPVKITVTAPFLDHHGKAISIDPSRWNHADMWDTILCPDVLVSRRELLLLVAERMQTSRNVVGMNLVAQCDWYIGRHLTLTTTSQARRHYWCCGTYNRVGQGSRKWATWVEVEGYDGRGTRKTSRLAFLVCAIQLKNINNFIFLNKNTDDNN